MVKKICGIILFGVLTACGNKPEPHHNFFVLADKAAVRFLRAEDGEQKRAVVETFLPELRSLADTGFSVPFFDNEDIFTISNLAARGIEIDGSHHNLLLTAEIKSALDIRGDVTVQAAGLNRWGEPLFQDLELWPQNREEQFVRAGMNTPALLKIRLFEKRMKKLDNIGFRITVVKTDFTRLLNLVEQVAPKLPLAPPAQASLMKKEADKILAAMIRGGINVPYKDLTDFLGVREVTVSEVRWTDYLDILYLKIRVCPFRNIDHMSVFPLDMLDEKGKAVFRTSVFTPAEIYARPIQQGLEGDLLGEIDLTIPKLSAVQALCFPSISAGPTTTEVK